MAEVKCSRCDRRYSGFRGRCPYCGTRRRKSGKRVSDSDNATWKRVIGILLLVILVAAVIVLLVTSLADKEPEPVVDEPTSPSFSQDDGVSDAESTITPSPSPSPTPSATPSPILTTETVEITYVGTLVTDFSMSVGEVVQLSARTMPAETDDTPIWSSDNEDVFVVLQNGKVTGIGKGVANVTVTCGAATATCIVRVG